MRSEGHDLIHGNKSLVADNLCTVGSGEKRGENKKAAIHTE